MNTINFDEHNQIDDLRIRRAISGLDESQMRQLIALYRERDREDEQADPDGFNDFNDLSEFDGFNEFDHCVGVLDVWLASDSWACLENDQKKRLMSAFAEMKTDAVKPAARIDGRETWPADSRQGPGNQPRWRPVTRSNWFLATLVPVAAALMVLAALPFGADRATNRNNGAPHRVVVTPAASDGNTRTRSGTADRDAELIAGTGMDSDLPEESLTDNPPLPTKDAESSSTTAQGITF